MRVRSACALVKRVPDFFAGNDSQLLRGGLSRWNVLPSGVAGEAVESQQKYPMSHNRSRHALDPHATDSAQPPTIFTVDRRISTDVQGFMHEPERFRQRRPSYPSGSQTAGTGQVGSPRPVRVTAGSPQSCHPAAQRKPGRTSPIPDIIRMYLTTCHPWISLPSSDDAVERQ